MSSNPPSPSSMMERLYRSVNRYLPGNQSESSPPETLLSTHESTPPQSRLRPDQRTNPRPQQTLLYGNNGPRIRTSTHETQIYTQRTQLDARVNRLIRENDRLGVEVGICERQSNELKKQAVENRQHIANLEEEIGHQKLKLQWFNQALAIEKKKNSELQAMVIARQELALRSLNAGNGPAPMEDHDIRSALEKLQRAIRSWARTYAVPNVVDLEGVPEAKLDLVVRELGSYCSETTWSSLNQKLSISVNRVPDILVQASLSRIIFKRIFEDPFFLLGAMTPTDPLFLGEKFGSLYNYMKQVDEVEAHAWRSQMLRLLSVPAEQDAQPLLGGYVGSSSSCIADFFIHSPAGILLKEPESIHSFDHRLKGLEDLLSGAANLALSLWTQRTDMICYSIYQLSLFRNGDLMTEAHRLHHLDDDDKRLDGADIVLFVQPAVVAFGSVHGEHYDQSKVWAAATVLVNEGTACHKPEHSISIKRSFEGEEPGQAVNLPEIERSTKHVKVERPLRMERSINAEKSVNVEHEDEDEMMTF